MDAAISHTATLLSAAARLPLPDLLSQLIDAAAGTTSDGIVRLAVRVPETSPA